MARPPTFTGPHLLASSHVPLVHRGPSCVCGRGGGVFTMTTLIMETSEYEDDILHRTMAETPFFLSDFIYLLLF